MEEEIGRVDAEWEATENAFQCRKCKKIYNIKKKDKIH